MNMKELVEMNGIEVLAKVKNKVHFSQDELKSLVFEEFITMKEETVEVVGGYAVNQTVLKVNDEYIMIEWLQALSMCVDNEYEQPVIVKPVKTENVEFVPVDED